MKISSNFIYFHNEFGLEKTIDIFSRADFEAIDFNADLEEYYTDAHNEDFYKRIREYAKSKGIVFSQTHAPFSSSFTDEAKTKKRFDEIVKSMKHSSWLGAEMIVVHPCKHVDYKSDGNYEYMLKYNLDFYKKLIPFAEEYKIKIAIENIGNCITETPDGLLDLLNNLKGEVFTVCYDVGHANICGQNPAEMIMKLGKNIGCTHIHDNDGIKDSHTLPFMGTIEWESVMKAFAVAGYNGNLNYEAGYFVKNTPVELRPDSASYMARVAKYLAGRIEFYKSSINSSL